MSGLVKSISIGISRDPISGRGYSVWLATFITQLPRSSIIQQRPKPQISLGAPVRSPSATNTVIQLAPYQYQPNYTQIILQLSPIAVGRKLANKLPCWTGNNHPESPSHLRSRRENRRQNPSKSELLLLPVARRFARHACAPTKMSAQASGPGPEVLPADRQGYHRCEAEFERTQLSAFLCTVAPYKDTESWQLLGKKDG